VPDESRKPVRNHHTRRSRPTAGGMLLWGFIAFALAYAVFLLVLGLTR
jgi:hypothetical protein